MGILFLYLLSEKAGRYTRNTNTRNYPMFTGVCYDKERGNSCSFRK